MRSPPAPPSIKRSSNFPPAIKWESSRSPATAGREICPGAFPGTATIGCTAAGLGLAAVTATVRSGVPGRRRALLAAAATVGHMLITAWAAPLNFSQRSIGDDPAALAQIFDRFETLNAIRAGLQLTALAALIGMFAAAAVPACQNLAPDG